MFSDTSCDLMRLFPNLNENNERYTWDKNRGYKVHSAHIHLTCMIMRKLNMTLSELFLLKTLKLG